MKRTNIAFDSASVRTFDDNGYLHVAVSNISKAVVNPYLGREIPGWQERGLDADRIYYGLRDAEELEKAAPTFNGLPLLLNHHAIDAGSIPKEAIIGATGTDAVFEAPYLKNSMTIYDAEVIKLIEDEEMKELSCGYMYTPDFTPGEWNAGNGQVIPYDFVMRNIKGNHLALVKKGRAGKDVYVADALPDELQGGNTKMKKHIMDFKKRRAQLANDADLGIEASEVQGAGFLKAVNVIEAQVEGYDPREVGLDIDAGASIDEIVDKFIPGLSDDMKAKYREVLTKLKGEGGAEDEGGKPMDDNKQTPPAANPEANDAGYEDERFKNPDFKAGFEEGVKYGEKREKANPERIDRDHEREGEERYLAQDTIENIQKEAVKQARDQMRELNQAAAKVRPMVGPLVDPMAFDSAEDIYKYALEKTGVKVDQYPPAAYKGMVDMAIQNKPAYVANDAALNAGNVDESVENALAGLNNISC